MRIYLTVCSSVRKRNQPHSPTITMDVKGRSSGFFTCLVFVFIFTAQCHGQQDCSRQDYEKCVKIADPLMKDPHLIFPDNMQDIDLVCRRWNQFVDCVKRYTDRCFTETRRQDFNKAIASPVDSVHQMCTDSQYQKEYLQYATCIKSTLIKEEHCGKHYRHLVEQVSGEVSRVTLCCSHHRFRECVLAETKRECDKGKENGAAARFSKQILDKALSFIRDQCYNYIPSSGYCPGIAVPSMRVDTVGHSMGTGGGNKGTPGHGSGGNTGLGGGNAPPDQQHGQTNNRPWQPQGGGGGGKMSTSLDDKRVTVSSAWMPSRSPKMTMRPPLFKPAGGVTPPDEDDDDDNVRPSSYGRGMSWTPANTEASDWLTKTWKVTSNEGDNDDENDGLKHKTDSWRPNVAGFGGGFNNEVDEPNQQGLEGGDDKSTAHVQTTACYTLLLAALVAAILAAF